ncbi:hypothetical protein DH2020_031615 [Rehmannia glutinosa]|uniref:Uncharacterized protein n=1 Tax=Rehmannia glutinosa TaxID=99300 RepID=A0ABR0VHM2_REHGL
MDEDGSAGVNPPPLAPPPPTIHPNVERVDFPKRSIISRPGFGTSGQRIPLLANHFKVSISNPDEVFYQYSVSISSEDNRPVENKVIGRKVTDKLHQTYSSELAGKKFAYDGEKSLYTVGPLPQNNFEFTVVLEDSIPKRNGSPSDNGSPNESSKGPNALYSQKHSRGCLLVRQSFFHDDSRMFTDVGGGVTGVRGFHSSFRPTLGGLSLNMDLLVHEIDIEAQAKKMLKNMRVKAIHSNMEFKIIGLSEKPCNQQFFSMKVKSDSSARDDGETLEITVYDYFVKHRNIELKYSAYLPCLDVGKPKRPNYLPLELCSLVSLQRYTKALSGTQRASLVEKSRQKPPERIRVVTDAVRNYHYDKDPLLVACGISIEKQLTQIDGRVLVAPKLKVGNSEDCVPRNGRWNFNNKKLLNPTKIDRWALVNFSARCDTSHLSRELINCGRIKGIHMERPYTIIEEDPQCRRASPVIRVERMVEQIMTKLPGPPEFLLCVLPERKISDIYGSKSSSSFSSFIPSGTNSLLAIEHSRSIPLITDTPTMILGMDVSHGSPGRSDTPSIAAVILLLVVGSRSWPLISRYRAAVRTQSSKVEMIESLFKPLANGKDDGIMRELLVDFYKTSNGRKPAQVIVFRDGVSESQFAQVLNIELDQIIKAYQHLGESDIPKFTVIVAQKNHHTKLFQASAAENVPSGTVVDTKIVHPRNYDFYMCSHAGMIGTSRPAHYHVLFDEIGFSPDDLQNLIHSLSYVYQRSTTAISIVAPVCYAHLAAQQMGQFMKFEDLSETSSGQKSMTTAGNIHVPELPRLHEDVAGSMFFC